MAAIPKLYLWWVVIACVCVCVGILLVMYDIHCEHILHLTCSVPEKVKERFGLHSQAALSSFENTS